MAAKLLRLGLVFVVLPTLLTGVALAQGDDLIRLVQAYQEAANQHDLDAIMAMWTDDAVFELVGMGKLVGPEQIRAIHDYDAGLHTELNFHNCSADGNTVTCEATERNDWQRAAQIPEYHYSSAVFTFKDSKIQSVVATMAPESAQILGPTMQAFNQWAMANRPDEVAKVVDENGNFIYRRESASIVVGMLKEWRAAVPQTLPTTGGSGVPETLPLWLSVGGLLLLALGAGLRKARGHT